MTNTYNIEIEVDLMDAYNQMRLNEQEDFLVEAMDGNYKVVKSGADTLTNADKEHLIDGLFSDIANPAELVINLIVGMDSDDIESVKEYINTL